MLLKVDTQPAFLTGIQIVIFIVLSLLIFFFIRRTKKLGMSAIIGIALLVYAAASLVGFHWAIPLIVTVIIFSFFDIFLEQGTPEQPKFRIRPVFFLMLVSFIWILVADFIESHAYLVYAAYVTNIIAQMGILWQRKSRLIKNDEAQSSQPKFICHAPLIIRSLLLTFLIAPGAIFFDKNISLWFTLVITIGGALIIETLYWVIEPYKQGKWERISFLRFTAGVAALVTFLQTAVCWWFYYDMHNLSLFRLLIGMVTVMRGVIA